MLHPDIQKNVRFNFTVNLSDAAFFGLAAVGLASTVTVIPLFLNSLGASEVLIGLVGTIHTIGWQLPQMFTAGKVSRLPRFKPMVMLMTIHERWPFFGLALIALLMNAVHPSIVTLLAFVMLVIYGLAGGLAATAWQSMIGKIMPLEQRGTFFGTQSALANLLGVGGALLAGVILERLPSPLDFFLCFFLAGVAMMISLWFLGQTREPAHQVPATSHTHRFGWSQMAAILRRDSNFRWFLVARMLATVAGVAISFYTIYALRTFQITELTAGVLTGVMTLSQTVANPIFGWLGDRWGHRSMFAVGALMIAGSAGAAMIAPSISWMYMAFGLAGAANAAFWAVGITLTLEFGADHEKPLYIGLANTPVALIGMGAPVVGGILAQQFGFHATFLMSMLAGLLMAVVTLFVVQNPQRAPSDTQRQMATVEG
jgi:MFS family permease